MRDSLGKVRLAAERLRGDVVDSLERFTRRRLAPMTDARNLAQYDAFYDIPENERRRHRKLSSNRGRLLRDGRKLGPIEACARTTSAPRLHHAQHGVSLSRRTLRRRPRSPFRGFSAWAPCTPASSWRRAQVLYERSDRSERRRSSLGRSALFRSRRPRPCDKPSRAD